VTLGDGIKVIVSVSGGDTSGGVLWTGSGVALSSGLIEALGEGLAVAVGVDFGFDLGVGDGDSAVVAGVFAWNGVDAASCARSRTAEANNTIPITNARMNVFNFWADASVHASAGSRAIQFQSASLQLDDAPLSQIEVDATKSCH
jgi:hypothetical protein